MAITIVENLNATQDEVRLPVRVHLTQTLTSSEASEDVDIEYSLSDDHDVWFDGPVKKVNRSETIMRAATPIEHRLKLVRGPGTSVQRPTIKQRITNPLGIVTTDRTTVNILDGDES